jgi:hypothetical protein
LTLSAARAGMDVKTARRYRSLDQLLGPLLNVVLPRRLFQEGLSPSPPKAP